MNTMKCCNSIAISLLTTFLYLVAPFVHADFDSGLIAYEKHYEYKRAYREFLAEARRGHRKAQFYLGEICEGGVGRPIDYETAFRWYLESAQQGYGPAQVRLASLYNSGKGVKKDSSKAFEWQKKAAEQGQVVAQYRLGRQYAQGIGTREDPVLAYMWWTVAASWGDPDAMLDRDKLAINLSAAQIMSAKALANRWEKAFLARTDNQ